jgi:hypothetical protein
MNSGANWGRTYALCIFGAMKAVNSGPIKKGNCAGSYRWGAIGVKSYDSTFGKWMLRTAYCLMPNHFHLVVETPHPNLVTGMKWISHEYTTRIQREVPHIRL